MKLSGHIAGPTLVSRRYSEADRFGLPYTFLTILLCYHRLAKVRNPEDALLYSIPPYSIVKSESKDL
jgi:hypothetical protein